MPKRRNHDHRGVRPSRTEHHRSAVAPSTVAMSFWASTKSFHVSYRPVQRTLAPTCAQSPVPPNRRGLMLTFHVRYRVHRRPREPRDSASPAALNSSISFVYVRRSLQTRPATERTSMTGSGHFDDGIRHGVGRRRAATAGASKRSFSVLQAAAQQIVTLADTPATEPGNDIERRVALFRPGTRHRRLRTCRTMSRRLAADESLAARQAT